MYVTKKLRYEWNGKTEIYAPNENECNAAHNVYTEKQKNNEDVTGITRFHCVPIIGYGTINGVRYWLFKNSWGSAWGENGYGRIVRGVDACKIESGMKHRVEISSGQGKCTVA